MSGPPIRVMFVDDHPMLRAGLSVTIECEDDMTAVAEAATGEDAVELYREQHPDVVLMDLKLPGMSGVEAIKAIRLLDRQARVIVLTTFDGDEDIYRSLRAGARGYLLKDLLRKELINAIRAVHAGQTYYSPVVAARLAERLPRHELSLRETEILRLVAEGKSNKEIAGQIGLSDGTVRIHLSHIFEKLGVHDRTQAAMQAVQRGIVKLGQ
ncbi:MAG: response regulator [Bryobacteraceae bacterium]